jgi:hypothetical protein
MQTHSIRLQAPWLVGLSGTTPTDLEAGKRPGSGRELAEQIRQLLIKPPVGSGIWAIRRFHRPTGLTPNSELCLAIRAAKQPDLVSWGPLVPGAPLATEHHPLTLTQQAGTQAEYRLPTELPLRIELRLEWAQLDPALGDGELTVVLVIKEPE